MANACRTNSSMAIRSRALRSISRAASAGGFAVLKDIRGATQFLLIPTQQISGIESRALLAPSATNYFAEAWQARRLVEKALGHAMPRDTLSLAINSELARSQNQLHIHIDCVRADIRDELRRERSEIGRRWKPLPVLLAGHRYRADARERVDARRTQSLQAPGLGRSRSARGYGPPHPGGRRHAVRPSRCRLRHSWTIAPIRRTAMMPAARNCRITPARWVTRKAKPADAAGARSTTGSHWRPRRKRTAPRRC